MASREILYLALSPTFLEKMSLFNLTKIITDVTLCNLQTSS